MTVTDIQTNRYINQEERTVASGIHTIRHASIDRSQSVHESTHWYICFCVLAVAVAVVVITKVNAPDCLYQSGAKYSSFHSTIYTILNTRLLGYYMKGLLCNIVRRSVVKYLSMVIIHHIIQYIRTAFIEARMRRINNELFQFYLQYIIEKVTTYII